MRLRVTDCRITQAVFEYLPKCVLTAPFSCYMTAAIAICYDFPEIWTLYLWWSYVPCICTHARWELSWVFRARINSLVYWQLFPGLTINRTGRLMRQNNTVSPWFNPEARVVDRYVFWFCANIKRTASWDCLKRRSKALCEGDWHWRQALFTKAGFFNKGGQCLGAEPLSTPP